MRHKPHRWHTRKKTWSDRCWMCRKSRELWLDNLFLRGYGPENAGPKLLKGLAHAEVVRHAVIVVDHVLQLAPATNPHAWRTGILTTCPA